MASLIGIAGGATDDNYRKLANHLTMLVDGNLLRGSKRGSPDNASGIEWRELEVTWQGHELLETIRDPEIWRKTKEGAGRVGNVAWDFVVDLAKAYAKQKAKEILGIEM